MQAGQHGSAAGVQRALPGSGNKVLGYLFDPRADPDVGGGAVQQGGPLNQHGKQRLSVTIRRTASLSAPNAGAGRHDGGSRAGDAGCSETGAVVGSAA